MPVTGAKDKMWERWWEKSQFLLSLKKVSFIISSAIFMLSFSQFEKKKKVFIAIWDVSCMGSTMNDDSVLTAYMFYSYEFNLANNEKKRTMKSF